MRVQKISIVGSISVLCTLLLLSPDGVNKNVLPGTNVLDSVICKDIYRAMNEIRFMENRGQYPAEVLYSARLANGNVFFCRDSVVFHLRFKKQQEPAATKTPGITEAGFSRKWPQKAIPTDSSESHLITLLYPGSHKGSAPQGIKERIERVNYFQGKDPRSWLKDISTFDTLMYKEIYPGIDLYFFDGGGRLKYEFRVQSFASYQDIRVRYTGIDSLSINETGDAVAHLGSASLVENAPVAYQRTSDGIRDCKPAFTSISGCIAYNMAEYNPSMELIIDPVYSTLFGGNDLDVINSMFVMPDGNVYVAGGTKSSDFPVITNSYNSVFQGDLDCYITVFNPDSGRILASTFLGGSNTEVIRRMRMNGNGQLIVSGSTYSADFPSTAGALQKQLLGSQDCFVAILDSNCKSLLYSTFIGNTGFETLFDMTLDSAGNIYITGLTDSWNFPRTAGAYQTQYGGGEDDVFVTKLSADGTRYLFSTLLGGNSYDEAYCILVDSSFNVYVAGLTSSYNFPVTANAIQVKNKWSDEGFFAVFDSSGKKLKYSTYFGGNSADLIETVILDESGNILMNGKTMSTDMPVTAGVFQPTKAVPDNFFDVDFFLAKYSPSENRIMWCTYLGGTMWEGSYSFITMVGNNILLLGESSSVDYPLVTPLQSHNRGMIDIVMTLVGENANHLLFSTYFGGNKWDGVNTSYLKSSLLYIAGYTRSIDYPITPNNIQDSLNGEADAVITIFDLKTMITIIEEMDETSVLIPLLSNYPNPFSSSGTTISYEITMSSPVTLSVFNSNGQMIDKREWPRLAVGKHVYQYHGNGIPPGVYFYTLQIGKEQITRKMVKVE